MAMGRACHHFHQQRWLRWWHPLLTPPKNESEKKKESRAEKNPSFLIKRTARKGRLSRPRRIPKRMLSICLSLFLFWVYEIPDGRTFFIWRISWMRKCRECNSHYYALSSCFQKSWCFLNLFNLGLFSLFPKYLRKSVTLSVVIAGSLFLHEQMNCFIAGPQTYRLSFLSHILTGRDGRAGEIEMHTHGLIPQNC